MQKFLLLSQFKGYTNKKDKTNIDPRYLVAGSQNVLINDAEKISIRGGYELLGAADTSLYPIVSSYDWFNSGGGEFSFRKYNTKLQFLYSGTWYDLMTLGASVEVNFAEWWSSTEAIDLLLFVDGTTNVYAWSGGVTTFASATANTITKQGTTTWAEERFLASGTRQVTIGGTVYTYTGGESTTTLTGVTPDPTAAGHTAGDMVIQTVRTSADVVGSSYNISLIAVLNNQAYYGDLTKRDIYVSKNTDYTDVTYTSSGRLPGEGAIATIDSNPVGFGIQDDSVYISSSKNDWYKTKFTLSDDLTTEAFAIERLKTGGRQGAVSQSAIGNIKNQIIFFGNDRTISTIGNVENINTPQSLPLSDPIKLDLESYDLTISPHVFFHNSKTYVAIPSESIVLIYDHEKQFWQAPQILPVRRLGVYDDELIGHSNAVPETYKLFTGTSDNTNPIDARANFAYRNYGVRYWEKSCDEWYSEGYISPNTLLTVTFKYEYEGALSVVEKDIDGADDKGIIFTPVLDSSLGKNPLGSELIGTTSGDVYELAKFRLKHELVKQDFYEIGISYSTNSVDARWELLAHGGNVVQVAADNTKIKR